MYFLFIHDETRASVRRKTHKVERRDFAGFLADSVQTSASTREKSEMIEKLLRKISGKK